MDRPTAALNSDMEKKYALLGRVYFFAVIPFVGAVLAPWILGPNASHVLPGFLLWSFSVLLFINASSVGYALGKDEKWVYLHGFIALVLSALGMACVLMSNLSATPFTAIALLTFLHWASWLWLQKSRSFAPTFFKHHNRFVWTALACHMLVLLNLIYVARTAF